MSDVPDNWNLAEWERARWLAAQWRAGNERDVLALTDGNASLLTKLLVFLNEEESRRLKRMWQNH